MKVSVIDAGGIVLQFRLPIQRFIEIEHCHTFVGLRRCVTIIEARQRWYLGKFGLCWGADKLNEMMEVRLE